MKDKVLFAIGFISFSVLLIFSILFFKERTVLFDISYHLFCILKDGTFAIQNNRFSAVFTQLFPLITSYLGFSLENVVLAYSLAFSILYFSSFLIIFLWLKNTRVAIAYLLSCVLMTTHTFYWIQSELPQGLAFLFIFLALLDNSLKKEKTPKYFYWLSAILLCIVCFTHPLLLIACIFSFLYFLLLVPGKGSKIIYSLSAYLFFYIVKSIFFKTVYDTHAFGSLNNIITLFPHYLNLESNKRLLQYIIHDYYLLIIILAIVTVFYLKNKSYKKLLMMVAFFFGYIFLVNISYPNGADQFYLENQYLVLTVFICIPFTFDLLFNTTIIKYTPVIISVIALTGVFRIYETHNFYTTRLNWDRRILKEIASLPDKKIIFNNDMAPKDTLLMTWSSSYEFWLISTLEQGSSRSVIIENTPNEFIWAMSNNKAFLTNWGEYNYNTLNKKYFMFNDTTYYVRK